MKPLGGGENTNNNNNNELIVRLSNIKGVLFDLDGTLVDTESLSDKAIFAALQEEGVLTESFIQEHGFNSDKNPLPWELKKQILGLRGSEWGPLVIDYAIRNWGVAPSQAPSVQQLWSDWEFHLNSLCCQVEACAGAYELVDRFVALGLPMAIATSSRRTSAEKKATNHKGMFEKISFIVAGDDPAVKQGKPAPDIYLEAARCLEVDPHECLVFEDALSGVKAGKAAGCFVVAVPDQRFTPQEKAVFSEVADLVVDDLRQFLDIGLLPPEPPRNATLDAAECLESSRRFI
jgi:pseudouridine 5'-phosphatase